ncbi:MAG: ferredoxin:thioredoxin reductase [Planctomycetes bacterium]|nr:ferredoxin:thioredoxin reductase [Planctomycetota bacterium]
MELTPKEMAIKSMLDKYVEGKDFKYHPDDAVVQRIIKGLAKRKEKTGKAYCPCRLVTGKPELDEKIICPCEFHVEEIKEHGMCHCQLFVSMDYEVK